MGMDCTAPASEGEAKEIPSAKISSPETESGLKEHDYIGLSEGAVSSLPGYGGRTDMKRLNLERTELRLGPPLSPDQEGAPFQPKTKLETPPACAKEALVDHETGKQSCLASFGKESDAQESNNLVEKCCAQLGEEDADLVARRLKSRQAAGGGDLFWHPAATRLLREFKPPHFLQSVHETEVNDPRGSAGAKRPFAEVMGDDFSGFQGDKDGAQHLAYSLRTNQYGAPAAPSWGVPGRCLAGKVDPATPSPHESSSSPQEVQSKTLADCSSSPSSQTTSGADMLDKRAVPEEGIATPPRAPVGWPPVKKSFFKNTSSAPQATKSFVVENEVAPKPVVAPPLPSPPPVNAQSNFLFVKVYMDGVPIGRKVDLKVQNSYDKLSATLEEMFHHFINGQAKDSKENKKLNFGYGSDYVLTYEDKDGDLMLVGDVPWGLFVSTVRRLRIMRGSDAIGLAGRVSEEVASQ